MSAPKTYTALASPPGPRFVGIDPGLGGGIVVLSADGALLRAARMPTRKRGKKRLVDAEGVAALLESDYATFVTIEEVGTRPGEGSVGAFSFGRALGIVEGAAGARHALTRLVRPQLWQSAMLPRVGGSTKERAVSEALRRWPALAGVLSVKVGWDIADAALIAEYGRLKLFSENP